ncbi:tyrosine-type recombinase/integrase [Vagococcus sp.]|uniref:tyrosine-type recombinase/integrase n=1 Tax=Vagococcus sp. TaxID=1933889 RepID=UPI002FC8271D
MARRGENIYKRKDGRWEGRYIKGRKQNGKIIYGYVYHQKYSSVKQQLIQFKALHQDQNRLLPHINADTVGSWLGNWLDSEVRKRVKTSTFASYQYKINHYILPYIGEESIQKVSEDSLQRWIDLLIEQKLSSATIKLIVQIFRMAIKSAQKKQIILTDPTKNLFIPKVKKRKIHALSIKEQKKIEEAASKTITGASILISLYTGLRIGEISALQWSDIDFSRQLIYVQRTLQRIPLRKNGSETQLVIQEAKTVESERIVPFSGRLKKYLLDLKGKSRSPFVVATKIKALEPRSITYHFRKIIEKIGLSHLHFHQLRHTFATRALELGGDIASISALLGHHSSKFTLDVYTDSLLHQREKISKKIEKKYFYSSIVT